MKISEVHTLNVEYDYKCPVGKWMSTNESVVCKDIMHKGVWEVTVGEELECVREQGNEKDRYTVTVMTNDTVSLATSNRNGANLTFDLN